jgi:acyl-coenzyme A thioesterase PaaI-like protein
MAHRPCAHSLAAWQWLLARDNHTRSTLSFVGLDAASLTSVEVHGPTPSHSSSVMLFPLRCLEPATNVFGSMHGGTLLTLTDALTSMHIIYRNIAEMDAEALKTASELPGHVTVSLSTKFITAVPEGTELLAATTVRKNGKRLVYTDVEFRSSCGAVVYATGSHIKAYGGKIAFLPRA